MKRITAWLERLRRIRRQRRVLKKVADVQIADTEKVRRRLAELA